MSESTFTMPAQAGPRPDFRPVGAGHWSIIPIGEFSVERRCLPGTLVIETTFTTPGGTAKLTSFDADALDAAEPLMPILGSMDATEPRMRSTIESIADELTEDGLVLRHRDDEGLNANGLTDEEGTFVQAFSHIGLIVAAYEIDKARGAA